MRIRNKNFNKKILSFFKVKDILKLKPRLLLVSLFIVMSVSIPLYSANASIWNWDLEDAILNSIYAIVYVLAAIALWVLSFFVMFGAWLVDVMLEPEIYAIVLNIKDSDAPLMIGWTVIRDFANTFFILILLLIAFSTILRIQKYSAKAFLPKFIIAIFLINFSAVIAAIIIDFGQVFMYEIKGWMGAFGGNNGAMGDLTSLVNGMVDTYGITPPAEGKFSLENTTGAVFAAVFAAIMGCVYIMLAGFLLIRLVVLAILIVLSPIAFLGIIMPGLSSHSGTWWKKIFEYSLFGPIFIFFVFLASTMASELTTVTYSLPPNDLTGLSSLVAIIVPYCVSIGMLLAVIPVTKQLGIAGSSALIGGTMGIGKIGMGAIAGAKLAGGLGKKAGAPITRRSGIPDKIRRGTDNVKGSIAENKWAQKTGISKIILKGDSNKFSSQRDQVEKEKKGWINSAQKDNLYGELKNSKGKSSAEIAAIIERMSEKKMLNEKDLKSHKLEGQTLSNILSRAKPALDASKLKESMPHWAAIVEAGPGKGKENIIEGRTKEITTEIVEENKLSSLNNAALENSDVMKTIFNQHDDPDKWLSSQSTARQDSANIGMENLLKKYQKEIDDEGVGGVNFNNVDNAAIGHVNPIGNTGMDGDKLRKEIDSIQKSLAKNDKNGHEKLNRPTILASGEIDIDLRTGRINFAGAPPPGAGTPEHAAWESRRKETAEGMKGETGFKYKSKEYYEDMGQYLAKAQLDTLRKAGSTEQMRAAKTSILAPGSTAPVEIRNYVDGVTANDYYKNL